MLENVFNCRDLMAAIELTNFGSQAQIAELLGVDQTTVSYALRKRCPELRNFHKSGGAYRSPLLGRGFFKRDYESPGSKYAKKVLKAKPSFTRRRPVSASVPPDCDNLLQTLRRHGSFEAAAQEIGVSAISLRHTFYGSGAAAPGKCQELAQEARAATVGGKKRSAMDLPGWASGVWHIPATFPEPVRPAKRPASVRPAKRPSGARPYRRQRGRGGIPILGDCRDILESLTLNDGSFSAVAREFGITPQVIQSFVRDHCVEHHPEFRKVLAQRTVRGAKPTFLQGFW